MPKQINVKMGFEADTSQAKRQIQDLQNSLTKLLQTSSKNTTLNEFKDGIIQAQQSVVKLQTALKSSLNADTGRLDLSKFNTQLDKSGLTVETLATNMRQLGPEGEKAFLNLANTVVTAQKPIAETNKLLDGMWTALKNTARWQMSSSILHGLMGAMSGAYGYAQDLDKSLNSIRIVSGQSAEQMAELAEHANRAAQALSTSTLAYTDAALIYYQQGLDPEEVARRTETTLKMSNVTGESADAVSSYMTAIWNNFAEGSDNLEYFADVITALGAATASSSEEIANGMQQFAAVAETVGLSYEYAASALATIVATTRQSESTVGNGLRTIFARFDSVKLGDTLEDGVGLTKYTEALQKAGVSVLDQNGQLKEMDEILNDIGERWNQLNRTQQTALAQTVGGVRQYTNLIALFDNWDFFQQNLQTAYGSTGSLQEQADIYAESWEAARKRVQAAWQAIYQDLIDDKFFITILNGIAEILKGVDHLIDSFGGLKGVISGIATVITTFWGPQLAQSFENFQQKIKVLNGTAVAEANAMVEVFKNQLDNFYPERGLGGDDYSGTFVVQNLKTQFDLNLQLRDIYDQLDSRQKSYAQGLMENVQYLGEEVIKAKELAESLEVAATKSKLNLKDKFEGKDSSLLNQYSPSSDNIQILSDSLKKGNLKEYSKDLEELTDQFKKELPEGVSISRKEIVNYLDTMAKLQVANLNASELLTKYQLSAGETRVAIEAMTQAQREGKTNTEALVAALDAVIEARQNALKAINQNKEGAEEETHAIEKQIEVLQKQRNLIAGGQSKGILGIDPGNFVQVAQGLSQISFGISSITGAWKAFTSSDLSPLEKFSRILTSMPMGLAQFGKGLKKITPMLISTKTPLIDLKDYMLAANTPIEGLTASFTGILSPLGQFVLVAGAVAGAAYLMYQWWNKDVIAAEKALKESKEALEQASDAAEQANKAYQDLSTTLDNWYDKRSGIDKLTHDTLEFKQAVTDANTELLKVLENSHLLGNAINIDDLKYDRNGVAYLDEEDVNKVLEAASNKVMLASATKALSEITVQAAQVDKVLAESAQKIWLFSGSNKVTIGDENYSGPYQEQKNSYSDKNTSEIKDDLEDLSSKIIEQGISSEQLTQQGINQLQNLNKLDEELSFLAEIADDSEMLGAVRDVVSAMEKRNDTENFHEARLGQEAAAKYNIDTGWMSDSDRTQFYVNLGKEILNGEDFYTRAKEREVKPEDRENFANANGYRYDKTTGKWYYAEGENVGQELVKGITDGFIRQWLFEKDSIADVTKDSVTTAAEQMQDSVMSNQAQRIANIYGQEGSLNFDKENWKKQLELLVTLSDEEIEKLGGWDALQERIDNLEADHEIPLNVKADDFSQLKSSVKDDDILEDVQDFANYIQKGADSIAGLSKHLANCRGEAERLAYAIMRFDDAIQDVTQNYDEWTEALKAGGLRAATALKDIAKAYGNVLDVDKDIFSGDFLEKIDNLEKMKLAIQGDKEAYEDLQAAAATDYLTNSLGASESAVAALMSTMQQAQTQLSQFNVGDVIPENMFASLYAQLNDMLSTLKLDVDQANTLMSLLGFNATLKTVEDEDQDELEGTEIETVAEDGGSYNAVNVSAASETGEESYVKHTLQNIRVKGVPKKLEGGKKKTKVKAVGIEPNGLHKAAGGQVKFQQATHGGGGVSPSSGKSGGGGGSKGTEKKKTVKEHKKHEQKTDRYHDIKERVEDLNRELKRLEKTESRVYGKAKLKYMDQEITKLEKQIDLTDEYIEEIKKYAKEDQARLRGINMGATFDDNGRLNNYEEVLANIVANYNSAVDAYNGAVDTFNGSAQEEADNAMMESAEKALSNAKDTYDEYLKILDQYEDTFNLLEEKIDERIDQVWALFDMRVKQVTFKIDFELDWNEKEIEHLQWLLKYTGKEADHAADSIANLAKQMQTYSESIDWAKQGIADLFKLHEITFDFNNADPNQLYNQLAAYMQANNLESQLTEDEANALIKYMGVLRDSYDGMYDSWMEAHEKLMDAWDQWNERLQNNIDALEDYAKEMQHIQKILDLVGRDMLKMSTEDVDKLYAVQVQNAQDQIEAYIAIRDAAQHRLEERQAHLATAIKEGYDQNILDQIESEVQEAEKIYKDAVDNVRSATENALELVENRFEAFIENTTKDYKDSFGKMGLDYIQEQFARQKELDELYLDDFQKYHELNKTTNEINKSLANTDNLTIRQKLLELQDEINASMEVGAKVSSAQAEIYARRVALLQAESELLDAQNAKSAVRMTRDNEGNFSYTYTADQDQIDDAEQNYGDKFYELLQFERDYAIQLQEEMLQKFQDFIDRRNEIAQTYKEGSDEYVQAMEDLQEEYLTYMDYFTDELNMDMDEMARLRDEDWQDFERYNDVKLAEYDDFLDDFGDLITGKMMPEFKDMEELSAHWTQEMKTACTNANIAVNAYQTGTQQTFKKAGADIDTYGKTVSDRLDQISEESAETAEDTKQMAEDMTQAMDQITAEANQLDYDWATVMESMRNQIDNTIQALNSLLQQLDLVIQRANEAMVAAAAAANPGLGAAGWNGGDYGGNGTNTTGTGTTGPGGPYADPPFTPVHGVMLTSAGFRSDGTPNVVMRWQTEGMSKSDVLSGFDPAFYKYFNTGGYTGDFGPEGKLAVLHEKELILNKTDTSNMLNIVDMVRDMVSSFNLNQRLDGLLSMATAATGMAGLQTQSLDQNVHIEASFPNVQSHNEIELALNNLINSASQFVNRK